MLVGLLGACAILLGAAGVSKMVTPAPTVRAVLSTDFPGSRVLSAALVVRILGAAEVAIGAGVIILGGRVAAAWLAVAYLALAVVAVRLVRHAPGQDCGCFGRPTEPVSRWHVGVNAMAVAIAGAAVISPQASLIEAAATAGGAGIVLIAGVLLLAWLGYLLMTALPELLATTAKVAATK